MSENNSMSSASKIKLKQPNESPNTTKPSELEEPDQSKESFEPSNHIETPNPYEPTNHNVPLNKETITVFKTKETMNTNPSNDPFHPSENQICLTQGYVAGVPATLLFDGSAEASHISKEFWERVRRGLRKDQWTIRIQNQ